MPLDTPLPPRPEPPDRAPGLLRGLTLFRGDIVAALPRIAYRREVLATRLLGRRILVVNAPDPVREVFVTRAANYGRKSHFKEQALRPLIGDSLFANHGETWARRRRPVARTLHPSGLAHLQPVFVEAGHTLASDWSARAGIVDVAPDLAAATLRVMLRAVFGPGVHDGEAAAIARAFDRFQSRVTIVDLPHLLRLPPWLAGRQRRATLDAAAEIRARIAALIATTKGEGAYLADLRAARAEDGTPVLDATGLEEEVAMFLLAGSETAANALCWTLYLLATHPAWADRARGEVAAVVAGDAPTAENLPRLAILRAVLNEAMRLYPPVAVLARQPAAPDRIRRWAVGPGDTVLCIPWLLHRHEAIWEAPHAFRPERFLGDAVRAIPRFAYLPFGVGPRICAGAAFGLAEMTTILAILLPRLNLAPAPGLPPAPRFRLTLRPEGGMRLRLLPRA